MPTQKITCRQINGSRCPCGGTFPDGDTTCTKGHSIGDTIEIEVPDNTLTEANDVKVSPTPQKRCCDRLPGNICSIGPSCRFEGENPVCTGGHRVGEYY